MQVTVQHLGGAPEQRHLDDTDTIQDLEDFENEYNYLINGLESTANSPLRNGDHVTVVPQPKGA